MFQDLPLSAIFALFAAAAAVVAVSGVRVTRQADRLADMTGLGEALVGAVLLGAITSLSGTVVSVTAALEGRASLAFSNGIGGIAAQTAALALADITHRRVNLEHASAELANIFQSGLLLLLLTLPMIAYAAPEVTVLSVHPVSLLLIAVYIGGVRAAARVREQPMWHPVKTSDTRRDVPEQDDSGPGLTRTVLELAVLALLLGGAGFVLAKTGGRISDSFGISETAVGALMTAVVTSMPELVTTLTAVRRGALQLAVGGIIGGNSFDVLFLSLSDAFYRDGSIYHAIARADLFWLTLGLAMVAVLLLGLVLRERQGPGNIGVESMAILALYAGAVAMQAMIA